MSSVRKEIAAQSIDSEALAQVLSGAYRSKIAEDEPLEEIRIHNSYDFEPRKKSSGEPRRIALYSSSSRSTLHGRNFGDLRDRHDEVRDIFADPRTTWWLDLQGTSESDLRLICLALRVHPLTIEDILNQETREKIEDYHTYYFACLWSTRDLERRSDSAYRPFSTYVVVFPTGTLTFSFGESHHPERVLGRIENLEGHLLIDSDWIFYAFMDDIVDSFSPLIARIEKRVDEIEDQVYTTRHDNIDAFLFGIKTARKNVSSLIRLLNEKVGILSTFEKRFGEQKHSYMSDTLDLYMKDVQDHVITFLSSLVQFDSLLSRSQNNFLAALSIETLQLRQRLNAFLGQVTLFTTIFSSLNIVCGVFSTNVNATVPLYVSNEPEAWYIILVGQIIIALVLWYTAKRYKWC